MKFKNKVDSSIVEATQWFKNGDHPEDKVKPTISSRGKLFYSEGKVVGYYRIKDSLGLNKCQKCNYIMNHHGLLGALLVCPTDWIITDNIITDSDLPYYPMSEKEFRSKYERTEQ